MVANAVNAQMCKENIPFLKWTQSSFADNFGSWGRAGPGMGPFISLNRQFQSWLTSVVASYWPDICASWRLTGSLLQVAALIRSLTWCPLSVCWSNVSIPGVSVPFASEDTVPAPWPLRCQASPRSVCPNLCPHFVLSSSLPSHFSAGRGAKVSVFLLGLSLLETLPGEAGHKATP